MVLFLFIESTKHFCAMIDMRTRFISEPVQLLLYDHLLRDMVRNKEMTRKKCCESKYYYIFYKLAISVGIELG